MSVVNRHTICVCISMFYTHYIYYNVCVCVMHNGVAILCVCVCVYCGSYLQAVAHTCIMRKINHYLMKLMASCFVCLLACRCVPIVPIVYNQLPPVCFCLCLFLCVLSLALVIVRRIDFIVSLYSFCSLICVLYLSQCLLLPLPEMVWLCITIISTVYPCILVIVY